METVPTFSVNNDNCLRQLASRHPTAELDVTQNRHAVGSSGFMLLPSPLINSIGI
jgi:hypothetical protein